MNYSITSLPQHGGLTNTDNLGDYTYTATNCYVGTDSFTYQMSDGLFTSPRATVYVMVADNFFAGTSYSPSPVIVPVNSGTNITIKALDLCGGSYATVSNAIISRYPAHGTLSNLVATPPQFTTFYTPSNNYSGPDSFEFQVSDACGYSASFIVPVTVGTNAAGSFTLVTTLNSRDNPNGIDYSPTQNALIVSEYGDPNFGGDNFIRLGTNANGGLIVTNFSGVYGIGVDEIKEQL